MQTHFPNFSLMELCDSNKAKEKGIINIPTFADVVRLSELCEVILQPLRDAWGSGIRVNSGYRCKALNKAVGGSDTSCHMIGYAADLYPANGRFEDFCKFVRAWLVKENIPFDQLIIESDKSGTRWLHVGLYNNSGKQRKQIKNINL